MNITKEFNINTYLDSNRNKIDETLVSLRLLKEVDDFIAENNISQRDFAKELGYSEAFISQLMSGTKKVNTAFINRFEKTYNLFIKFTIHEQKNVINDWKTIKNDAIEMHLNVHDLNVIEYGYESEFRSVKFDDFVVIDSKTTN